MKFRNAFVTAFIAFCAIFAGCDMTKDKPNTNASKQMRTADPSLYPRCAGSYEPEKCAQQEQALATETHAQASARRSMLEDERRKNMALANAEPIQEITDQPSGKSWWSPNSSFSTCIPSNGPAARLDGFVGNRDTPSTQEYKRSDGTLWKVEVINPSNHAGNEEVWTYYSDQQTCLAEKVNATKALADRYR